MSVQGLLALIAAGLSIFQFRVLAGKAFIFGSRHAESALAFARF